MCHVRPAQMAGASRTAHQVCLPVVPHRRGTPPGEPEGLDKAEGGFTRQSPARGAQMSPRGLLVAVLTLLLGFSVGLNVGQWRMGLAVDRLVRETQEEARLRNDVAEGALNLLAESKYQIQAAKAEAGRRLRNKEDGRR